MDLMTYDERILFWKDRIILKIRRYFMNVFCNITILVDVLRCMSKGLYHISDKCNVPRREVSSGLLHDVESMDLDYY